MEYKKDFDAWNSKKKEVEDRQVSDRRFFHERQVWWCSLGLNIGFEQDGKNKEFERPMLIIKKFNEHVVWAVPLTTIAKDNKFHYQLKTTGSFIILSQLRLVSTKRFLRLVRIVSEVEFEEIVNRIKQLFPLGKTKPRQ